MKIVLDRRSCNCWQAACESHFGSHFLQEEVTPVDCTLEISDDGQAKRTFLILDRDGIDKTMVVDEDRLGEAFDSWLQFWEKQHA